MKASFPLPVNTSGPGPTLDISALNSELSISLTGGSSSDVVQIEFSGAGLNWSPVPNAKFSGPGGYNITTEAPLIRANHLSGDGTMEGEVMGTLGAAGQLALASLRFSDVGEAVGVSNVTVGMVNSVRRITACFIQPETDVTAGFNYKIVELHAVTAAGVDRGIVATIDTSTVSWIAQQTQTMTLGSIQDLLVGDQLLMGTSFAGGGVDLGTFRINAFGR